uniref:Putative transcription regulatory protein n=1 Tax=viral metagenome TaxID=1070528 RepID=A0A6M3KPT9_9ZZZZ
MTPLEIQFELKKRGKMQKDIADRVGVSGMTVSKVIHRLTVSDRVMREIAAAIEKDHREVFADYYFRPAKRSTSKVISL